MEGRRATRCPGRCTRPRLLSLPPGRLPPLPGAGRPHAHAASVAAPLVVALGAVPPAGRQERHRPAPPPARLAGGPAPPPRPASDLRLRRRHLAARLLLAQGPAPPAQAPPLRRPGRLL